MSDAVRRITSSFTTPSSSSSPPDDTLASALSRSFVLSADMAHAVHPNYAAKHEKGHGPRLNAGLVRCRLCPQSRSMIQSLPA